MRSCAQWAEAWKPPCGLYDTKNSTFVATRYCKGMSGVKARKWVVRSHFDGQPKREDLEIVEEELPPIKDGGQGVSHGGGRVVPSLA